MNKRPYMDIGAIFDDIFEAAKDFGERVKNFSPGFGGPNQEGEESRPGCHGMGGAWFEAHGDDNVIITQTTPIRPPIYTCCLTEA